MHPMDLPLTRDLVLIGGGHAHALVLRLWGMRPVPGVRLTLINPGPTAPYSGMLPGHIAGHYAREDLDIDLVKLARFANARLIIGAADAIDPNAKTVNVSGRVIAYDVASIDVGIHAQMPSLEGFMAHGVGVKPLDVFADKWRAQLGKISQGNAKPSAAVIGGGVAGAEIGLAMAHAMERAGRVPVVTVVDAGEGLSGLGESARAAMLGAMAQHGVTLIMHQKVERVEAGAVQLVDGTRIGADFIVGAGGAMAHDWLASGAVPTTPEGFVLAEPTLQVAGFSSLFAVGDCAHLAHAPRPKAGVYAVRAAPVLAQNLRVAVTETGKMARFSPQRDFLKLISLGGKSAMAQKWGRARSGPALWRWKDSIDQKFMDQFRRLPAMPAPEVPDTVAAGVRGALEPAGKVMCGGCGSKVGAAALAKTLETLPEPARKDVVLGAGDDAAILKFGRAQQVITVDHLRAFTNDYGLLARITAVHALGDVWSMGAAPQAALVSVILPNMSDALQVRTLTEIMDGFAEVITNAGADIIGGHSTLGAEMTLGLTVTGVLEGAPIGQTGAKAGDVLILTRPIGTGVMLAGEMAGRATGGDVAVVLDAMATPQGKVAQALLRAHAMTDVTGFGLAGHLMAMCRASAVGAELDLQAVPFYPGAVELAEAGIRSTIWAQNAAFAPVAGGVGARAALLHDPQTAGGFLAALAPQDVDAALAQAREAGGDPVVIGRIVEGRGEIRVL